MLELDTEEAAGADEVPVDEAVLVDQAHGVTAAGLAKQRAVAVLNAVRICNDVRGDPCFARFSCEGAAHADRGHRVMAVELEGSGCNGETLCITGNGGLDVSVPGSLDIHREGDHLTVPGHAGESELAASRISENRGVRVGIDELFEFRVIDAKAGHE